MQDMMTAENGCVTTGKPKTTCEEMLNAIGDTLSDLASSDDEQDGEDNEDNEDEQISANFVMMLNLPG
jgi:hypothetical protein